MKIKKIVTTLILLSTFYIQAQFSDNMESYSEGNRIYQDHWADWNCGGSCAIIASSEQSHSGNLSGLIPGDETTDAVLDLGNKIFGVWHICFWMYIPTDKSAYMNIACGIPNGACEPIGHFYFNLNNTNPGVCELQNIYNGSETFNYPQDQWFNIDMNFDISNGTSDATWSLQIDGLTILPPGTPLEDDFGTPLASLGGIEFFSYFNNIEFYVDDFIYQDSLGTCLLSTTDITKPKLSLSPNPADNQLTISSNTRMAHITIFNALGKQIINTSISSNEFTLDVSGLANGIYFMKVKAENEVQTIKFIKESAN